MPRVTFGMIVLNGEPFVRYNLEALYPFAHQIVVVEGAAPGARSVASPGGHSRDATLETLREFARGRDPEGKIVIVTAEDEGHPDAFWSEKDEMSAAYASRATGDYLWQIDSDEFYRPEDMRAVLHLLDSDPSITSVTFPMRTFCGGIDYEVTGFFLEKFPVHRIFRWGPGYRYSTHRPPTVLDTSGRDVRTLHPLGWQEMKRRGIYMHHYELLFPKQVIEKCRYYAAVGWTEDLRRSNEWVERCYLRLEQPFRVHMTYNHRSWYRRFRGTHPPTVTQMVADVGAGKHPGVALRPTEDIDALLSRRWYRVQSALLEAVVPIDKGAAAVKESARRLLSGGALWRALQLARRRVASPSARF